MALNLKKIQSSARRKLKLRGKIEFRQVSRNYATLNTTTNALTNTHTISYSHGASLDPADVYHELCKAKLNEIGFTTIENASLTAMRDCCKNDPKYIRDANSAETIVIETYSNTLLFKTFPEESNERRTEMVLRFESSDALTSLHTQMGFWGTAATCYYREASKRSDVAFPEQLVENAIERATDADEIRKEYDAVNSRLAELPDISQTGERITDEQSVKIIEIIVELFSAKTGLEC